jgi:hypothetical protein
VHGGLPHLRLLFRVRGQLFGRYCNGEDSPSFARTSLRGNRRKRIRHRLSH